MWICIDILRIFDNNPPAQFQRTTLRSFAETARVGQIPVTVTYIGTWPRFAHKK